jgi:hypothetical protein
MSLRTLNLSASILHFTLAIAFGIYFANMNNTNPNQPVQGVELTVRDHTLDAQTITGNCVPNDTTICDASGNGFQVSWTSALTQTFDIKTIQTMLISFFLITGSFHLYYYLGNEELADGEETTWRTGYTAAIKNQNNFFRWIEYSITATLMLYIIAFTSGVKDTNVYLLLYATNVAMIAMGQQVEVAVRDGKDWTIPMITSFLLLFAEFSVIIRSFWNRLAQVNEFLKENPSQTNNAQIPSWLNYMIIVLFLFFSCFGFVSLYGAYAKTSYESVEKAYIILSFVAKATLGVFIAYGTGQRQRGWRNNNN